MARKRRPAGRGPLGLAGWTPSRSLRHLWSRWRQRLVWRRCRKRWAFVVRPPSRPALQRGSRRQRWAPGLVARLPPPPRAAMRRRWCASPPRLVSPLALVGSSRGTVSPAARSRRALTLEGSTRAARMRRVRLSPPRRAAPSQATPRRRAPPNRRTPNRVAPNRWTPSRVAPAPAGPSQRDWVCPRRRAPPSRGALSRGTPSRRTRSRMAPATPQRLAPMMLEVPSRAAPNRLIPSRAAPNRSTPNRVAPHLALG
jgi:hypothetical protein